HRRTPKTTILPYTTLFRSQISLMKEEKFEESENLTKYFNLLPDEAFARKIFLKQQNEEVAWVKEAYEAELRNLIIPGRIEVNIRSEEHTSELQSRENLVCR